MKHKNISRNKIRKIIITFSFLLFALTSAATAYDLTIQGSAGEVYDDNTNNSAEDPHTDYITSLMLGLGINLEGRTQNLQLLGHIYQQLYYDESDLNNNSQDLVLNYTKEFTARDRFALNDTFSHYPEPRNFQDMFGQPAGRNGYYTNTLTLSFDKDLISYFSANIHYNSTITRSEEDTINNSIINGAGASLNFSFNAFNIVYLLYDYINTQYESGEENDQQNIQHTAGLGYQHYFTQQLYASFAGGIDYVKTRGDTEKTPYLTLSLTDDIDENNTINLSAARRYQTTLLTNEVFDSWTFSALFTREVSERFSFAFNAYYQYGMIVSSLSDTESRLFGITTSGNYSLSENMYARISYTYTKTRTEENTTDVLLTTEYNRNQVELSINAEY